MKSYFVTGTDTDAGKTLVTLGLLQAAKEAGLRTLAIKPVAAGGIETPAGLRNDDALLMQQTITESLTYEQVNPVMLPEPLSPHITAARAGRHPRIEQIAGYCGGVLTRKADLLLMEGAGGWRVPLNQTELMSELPRRLELPVILVVGLKLGCLNHALLTAEAIRNDGLQLAAWAGSQVDPAMAAVAENIASLNAALGAPCLGIVPPLGEPSAAAAAPYLTIAPLIDELPLTAAK